MQLMRIALSGVPQCEADSLREYCASVTAKWQIYQAPSR
jgi:hypothetical protein